jgi:formylglycine-generating enzyme required for sulfatase activity
MRLVLALTMLTIAAALLLAFGSLPPLNLVSPVSAQKKGGVVKPTPTPTPTLRRLEHIPPKRGKSGSSGNSIPRRALCVAQSPKRGTGNRRSVDLGGGVKLEMVEVPPGNFCMGSTEGAEVPVHRVTIWRRFYIGIYEVTQAQWRALMGNNPSAHKGDDLPVESVSWEDAQKFIRKLNDQRDGYVYGLPSEAEWEYAARAGTTGEYAGNLNAMAWYDSHGDGRPNDTHPVGRKKPNAFGLFDIHGNVWEWCEDWLTVGYQGAPTDGSVWLNSRRSSRKIARGGAFDRNAYTCRSASRTGFDPDSPENDLGFRITAVVEERKEAGRVSDKP